MSHYEATFIHGHVLNMDEVMGMVIECDAPSDNDAAEILFTAANRGNEAPVGVTVVEPLRGCSMTVGDLAIVRAVDSDRHQTALWCDLMGWRNGGPAPEDSPAGILSKLRGLAS